MIKGADTDTVFLSQLLLSDFRYSETCRELMAILTKHRIPFHFLSGAKDIWCRDYMPIQVSKDRFVQFRYEPSYLKPYPEYYTDPDFVCTENGIVAEKSNIILDGGNLVSWSDKVIMTDRFFDENPDYSNKAKLVSELENQLETEVIIIPQVKMDYTGHADGMVRFVDESTLIGNDRDLEYQYWTKEMNVLLEENGLDYIDIPFFEYHLKKYPLNAIGCYVNYLEVKNLIVVPIFEVEGNKDREIKNIFKKTFPDRIIETINFNEIGYYGGLLNCVTWTVQSDPRVRS
ncbi:agmatine deiminase family protein [Aquiflexum sp.]|uniref:agmatine deiminase family protein n=1 Tax=Aquiflexum sp. TaxID=1872584 RepID=UPI003593AC02